MENLRIGDRVRTALNLARADATGQTEDTPDVMAADNGPTEAPIVWIGRREVDCAHHPKPRQVWPVRIAAGAFGAGLPHNESAPVAGPCGLCQRGADTR